MEFKFKDMGSWERQKAIFLMQVAEELRIDLDSYGEVAVNNNSGYTYLWSEDHNFSLYMPIDCELQKSDIYALWSCSECGEEIEYKLKQDDNLTDIEDKIQDIEKEHYKEVHPQEIEN